MNDHGRWEDSERWSQALHGGEYLPHRFTGDERICDECAMPETNCPHRTDEGYDPRVRAFASERMLGIPKGSPHCA